MLFTTAPALIATLVKAHAEGRLEDRLGFYAKRKLLIVDELGYLTFEPQGWCRGSGWNLKAANLGVVLDPRPALERREEI